MRLWYDATESRCGSRLPQNVIQFGTKLVGLEGLTGGDLLLSPLDEDIAEEDWKAKLFKHCRAGVLVQRKSGMDLVSSLSRLSEIQCKMQAWGDSWLLVTGKIGSKNGVAVVEGRRSVASYKQVIGAMDNWILRGGGVTCLESDDAIGGWVEVMLRKLVEMRGDPVKTVLVGVNRQKLVQANLATHEMACVSTMSTFPGISYVMAQRIARETGGRLCGALEWISSNGKGVKGVGEKTVKTAREWMGLKDKEAMRIYNIESTIDRAEEKAREKK
jgi:hypothetical protein